VRPEAVRPAGGPRRAALALACAGLAACADTPAERAMERDAPEYLGIETRLLEGDLVNFIVRMRGGTQPDNVQDYARCAAAQYTLIRGYGFARQVRTSADVKGSLWRADAVYTISPSLPRGARTIDAEVTVADCVARGIPTV
jgi:hypothetical protein